MRKKYRIKRNIKRVTTSRRNLQCRKFTVQVHVMFGLWVNVKAFRDEEDPDFARREAEELLDKLNEK